MRWALILVGILVVAAIGWALAAPVMIVAVVGGLVWWLIGANRRALRRWWRDRQLRRGARGWAKARRAREEREALRNPKWPRRTA